MSQGGLKIIHDNPDNAITAKELTPEDEILLNTREYIIPALHMKDWKYILSLHDYDKYEVFYLQRLIPSFALTLLRYDCLNSNNVVTAVLEQILSTSLCYEYEKGVIFYYKNLRNSLQDVGRKFPEVLLNLDPGLSIEEIPNVNIETTILIELLSRCDNRLSAWFENEHWNGKVGKWIIENMSNSDIDLIYNGLIKAHPENVVKYSTRKMYLEDKLPNITESNVSRDDSNTPDKIAYVFLLDDPEFIARCLLGFDIIAFNTNSISITGESNLAFTLEAFAILLKHFPGLAPRIDGLREYEILTLLLEHRWTHAAENYIRGLNEPIRSKMKRELIAHYSHSTCPDSYPNSSNSPHVRCCEKILTKSSFIFFVKHFTMMECWKIINHCRDNFFLKLFFRAFPNARIDIEDLMANPMLFYIISQKEQERVSGLPGYLDFVYLSLEMGYRGPIYYLTQSQRNNIPAKIWLRSGILLELKLYLDNQEFNEAEIVQYLPTLKSQTIEYIRRHPNYMTMMDRVLSDPIVKQNMIYHALTIDNIFRVKYYYNLGIIGDSIIFPSDISTSNISRVMLKKLGVVIK